MGSSTLTWVFKSVYHASRNGAAVTRRCSFTKLLRAAGVSTPDGNLRLRHCGQSLSHCFLCTFYTVSCLSASCRHLIKVFTFLRTNLLLTKIIALASPFFHLVNRYFLQTIHISLFNTYLCTQVKGIAPQCSGLNVPLTRSSHYGRDCNFRPHDI
jgi:hypothetical protein